jgi:hypothetical protein
MPGPGENFYGGRFAGAVGTDEGVNSAFGDGQVEVAQGLALRNRLLRFSVRIALFVIGRVLPALSHWVIRCCLDASSAKTWKLAVRPD